MAAHRVPTAATAATANATATSTAAPATASVSVHRASPSCLAGVAATAAAAAAIWIEAPSAVVPRTSVRTGSLKPLHTAHEGPAPRRPVPAPPAPRAHTSHRLGKRQLLPPKRRPLGRGLRPIAP